MHCCCLVDKSCSTLLRPCGQQPAKLLCPCNFPGKNAGVGYHFLFGGSFWPRDQTCISSLAGGFFTTESPGKPKPCVVKVIFQEEKNQSTSQDHTLWTVEEWMTLLWKHGWEGKAVTFTGFWSLEFDSWKKKDVEGKKKKQQLYSKTESLFRWGKKITFLLGFSSNSWCFTCTVSSAFGSWST